MRTLALAFASTLFASTALAAPFSARVGVFDITPDLRECASPLCGGWWISPVNHRRMICPDGTAAAACYVADIEWSALGFTPDELIEMWNIAGTGKLLVHGRTSTREFAPFGRLGWLTPRAVFPQYGSP